MSRRQYIPTSVSNPVTRPEIQTNQGIISYNCWEQQYSDYYGLGWKSGNDKTDPIKVTFGFRIAFITKINELKDEGLIHPVMAELVTYLPLDSLACRTRIFNLPCIYGNNCATCIKMVNNIRNIRCEPAVPPHVLAFANEFFNEYRQFNIGGTIKLASDGIHVDVNWKYDDGEVRRRTYVVPFQTVEPQQPKRCIYFQKGHCQFGDKCKFGHY